MTTVKLATSVLFAVSLGMFAAQLLLARRWYAAVHELLMIHARVDGQLGSSCFTCATPWPCRSWYAADRLRSFLPHPLGRRFGRPLGGGEVR